MDILDFYSSVQIAINTNNSHSSSTQIEKNYFFLDKCNEILTYENVDNSLKASRLTILFEGFYRSLEDSPYLKKLLLQIRAKRWSEHFGTPTILFLLSYQVEIEKTKQLFNDYSSSKEFLDFPWNVEKQPEFELDHINDVIVNPRSTDNIAIPDGPEITGAFTKTHNPSGGYTTTACDHISQQFIKHAGDSARFKGKVLEIGAGFGAATLGALAKNATVFCNDINAENLAVVRRRYLEKIEYDSISITGDENKLTLIPGSLPDELEYLPSNFFDAILICRVLHFFTGEKIEESLLLLSRLLAPAGKIYIVCETPFLKNWQSFIPEFNKRMEQNIRWPGQINNPANYESSGRTASLPKLVHWFTKEILERCLLEAGFDVEQVTYINRNGQFPNDLLLPEIGKESVGGIGVKLG